MSDDRIPGTTKVTGRRMSLLTAVGEEVRAAGEEVAIGDRVVLEYRPRS